MWLTLVPARNPGSGLNNPQPPTIPQHVHYWSPLYDINHFCLYSILMQYLIFVFSSPCLLMSALSILEGKPLEDIDYSCQHSSEEHLALNYILQISTY